MADTNARCTVVVSSCDGYADIWPAFFTLLERRWPDNPFPVALNTESLPAPCAGVTAYHTAPGTPWTRRLQSVLQRLGTPYTLILLDDFFFTAPVETAELLSCIDRMDSDPSIACFSFFPTTGNPPHSDIPGYDLRPQDGLYRFNAQAGLWRTERLISFLDADENAWEWENNGNLRSFAVADRFYSRSTTSSPVFAYDFMKHGLIGGKWFPETAALFAAEGIDMDFSRRGFYDPQEWALLPSVASAFTLDSELYADAGAGYDAAGAQTIGAPQKRGSFSQIFAVAPGTLRLRWDPSTRKGFALQELCAELCGADTHSVTLSPVGGNGVSVTEDGKPLWVFLEEDPQLVFIVPRALRRCGGTLTVRGSIRCPISRAVLTAAKTVVPPSPQSGSLIARLRRLLHKGG